MQARTRAESMDGAEATPQTRVPRELESPRGKLVYLYLATHGAVTEDELCDGLDMTRLSLYSILSELRDRGLVRRESDRYFAC